MDWIIIARGKTEEDDSDDDYDWHENDIDNSVDKDDDYSL